MHSKITNKLENQWVFASRTKDDDVLPENKDGYRLEIFGEKIFISNFIYQVAQNRVKVALKMLTPPEYVMQTLTDFEVCWWFLNPFHFYLICLRCNDSKFKCIQSRVWFSLEHSWVGAVHLERIMFQCETFWLHLQPRTHAMPDMV